MKAHPSSEEKNPFELIEEAFYLLRRAPAAALAAYYLGALPFVLGLLFFWSDMARSAFAAERLWPGSMAMAAGFVWMKTWQAVFARHLQACLCGEEPPAWRLGWLLRVAVFQAFLQPLGLFLLPPCLLILIPFGWAYAFFSNVTVLGGSDNQSVGSLCRRAWRQATLWPLLTHNLLFTLSLFCLLVFANLYSAVLGLPMLLDRLLGIESVFSRAPWAAMNSTVTAAVAGLTYLCCDPLLKAVFALRCFYGESLRTGQDLRAELRRCQGITTTPSHSRTLARVPAENSPAKMTRRPLAIALLLLLPLAGSTPLLAAEAETPLETPAAPAKASSAAIPPGALQGSIDHVIQQREYSWRLPRETSRKQDGKETWMEYLNRQLMETLKSVARWFVDLIRWLGNQLSRGTPAGSGATLAFAVRALLMLLVAALVGFLVWLVWRLWTGRERRTELEVTALPPAPDLADDNVGAEQLPEDGWLQMARDLLARGELRLALRAFYLATLAHLAQRNLITLARFKSNRDYERELERRGHALSTVFEHFAQNRVVFEQVWYGRHEITGPMLHEFAGNLDRIKRLVKKLSFFVLLVAAGGFVYGLVYLFQLRFETGDNYPEYSSLRADPLGSKALYASLDRLVETRRHFRSLDKLEHGQGATLLYLGAPPEDLRFTPADSKYLETYVRSGGRLVIALFPAYHAAWKSAFPPPRGRRPVTPPAPAPAPGPPASGTNNPPGFAPPTPKPPAVGPDPFALVRRVSITEHWGLDYGFATLHRDATGSYQPATALRKGNHPSLPQELAVHSAVYFTSLDPAWRVIYSRSSLTNANEMAVVIERPWGRGTLVLASDAYPFSNEALRQARPAALLSWFVGPNRHVTFEEGHLGVTAQPGIAALARQYRLGSLFVALLVLAGLFVWKSSVSFLPPPDEEWVREHGNEVGGRDSASGLTNLLSRHLRSTDLMKTCLEQWNEQVAGPNRPSVARLEAMQQLIDAENALEPAQRNPIRLYREFSRILARRKV